MSGFDGKTPGHSSGVTAADLASGDVSMIVPGKKNLVQTYDTGSQYADAGPKCDGKDESTPGCFLSDKRRSRLIEIILDEIQTAQTNYKLALIRLEIGKLIEKEDDLPWVIGLALDIASAHLSSMASKALNRLKVKSISKAENAALDAARRDGFDDDTLDQKTADALLKVTDKTVEITVKAGFDAAKKQTPKAVKAITHDADRTEKAAALSYIDQLKESCDVAFQTFKENAVTQADDAQLVVFYQGMHPRYHSIGQYEAALSEKLARYNKAGVGDIGQKAIAPLQAHVATLYANKRCVWLREADGNRSLWFYSNVSGIGGDPWDHGREVSVEKVPDEFVEASLAKSEEKWGATPTLDHPGAMIMRRLQLRNIPAPQVQGTKS